MKLAAIYEKVYCKKLYGKQLGQFSSDFELSDVPDGTTIYSEKSIFIGKKNYYDKIVGYHKGVKVGSKSHMRLKGVTEAGLLNHVNILENSEYNHDRKEGCEILYEQMSVNIKHKILLNPVGKVLFDTSHDLGVFTKKECYRTV
jgi:hypothetical protein